MTFKHATKGQAEYAHDYHAFENQAAQVAANWGSRGNPFIMYDEIKKCMTLDYGWEVANHSPSPQVTRHVAAPHPPPDPPPAPLSVDDQTKLTTARVLPMGSTAVEVRAALGRDADGFERNAISGGHLEEIWTYRFGSATVKMRLVDGGLAGVSSR